MLPLSKWRKETILFNLCGHGHFDMQAYGDYFNNKLSDDKYNEAEVNSALEKLPKLPKGNKFYL